jgi:flagellar biosynthesis protein FlhG
VTTPDATAMTDAYAFIKVLHARRPDMVPLLTVNRVVEDGPDEASAQDVAERIVAVCRRFLALAPRAVGSVPDDRAVGRSVATRRPVVREAPGSPAALALRELAARVRDELARCACAERPANGQRSLFGPHR